MSVVHVKRPPVFAGPQGAAYLVERMIERWQHPIHQSFLAGWAADYHERHHPGRQLLPNGFKWLMQLDEHLQQAPLYALEDEVMALVQAGGETMPDQPIIDSDLPAPSGLIVFSHPVEVVDKRRETYGVSAVLWAPAIGRSGVDDSERHAGTMTVHFTTNTDLVEQAAGNPNALRELDLRFPPLSVLHVVFMPHGMLFENEPDIPPETADSHLRFIKLLQSFWAFVQQEVVDVEHREMPRPIRKRAERAQRETSTLHVVKLRRVASSTVERAESDHHVSWQSRWIVRGHWRQQWYAKSQTRRAIWIYPFVKGPADKPLVAKRTVFDVRR